MTYKEMQATMYAVFNECDALRQAGQAEYAGEGNDAFANFNRLAESLRLDRKAILLVYASKHWDGISSFVAGHTSQREDVRGRINDQIVYLTLLRGMIDEEQGIVLPKAPSPLQSNAANAAQQLPPLAARINLGQEPA